MQNPSPYPPAYNHNTLNIMHTIAEYAQARLQSVSNLVQHLVLRSRNGVQSGSCNQHLRVVENPTNHIP